MTLHIHLNEGFDQDTVSIQINSEQVYHMMNVTTRNQIGLADQFATDVEEGLTKINIEVPTRNASLIIEQFLQEENYLGLNIENNQIISTFQQEPFLYM